MVVPIREITYEVKSCHECEYVIIDDKKTLGQLEG